MSVLTLSALACQRRTSPNAGLFLVIGQLFRAVPWESKKCRIARGGTSKLHIPQCRLMSARWVVDHKRGRYVMAYPFAKLSISPHEESMGSLLYDVSQFIQYGADPLNLRALNLERVVLDCAACAAPSLQSAEERRQVVAVRG